jgi:DNA-binding CsgD family transcriptional regulator
LLSDSDVRAAIRLVSDVAASTESITQRKRYLAAVLCELTGADSWMWVVSAITDDEVPAVYNRVYGGLSRELAAAIAATIHEPEPEPVVATAMGSIARNEPVTVLRQDFVDDRTYFGHPAIQKLFRAERLEQSIYTFIPVREHAVIQGVAMHRVRDRRPFTEREKLLVHSVLMAMPWFHSVGVADQSSGRLVDLSSRERMFLDLLMDDLSPRELAKCLGLSVHTVNDYTKTLYRRMGVNSRPELVARFSKLVDLSSSARKAELERSRARQSSVLSPSTPRCEISHRSRGG